MFTSTSLKDKEMNAKVKTAANHAQDGAQRIKKDANDTVGQLHSDLEGIVHSVGERVRDFVENAEDGIVQARETLADATDNVTTQIRRNPLPATAIALGIGVIVGALLRRR
jgi:ElaB/YqjD/DUF883 family membrane-anchored ribosome-binding protein